MLRPFLLLVALLAGSAHASSERPGPTRFALCHGPGRVTCVVDGDTFWLDGVKIRLADVNAPEVSRPRCAAEARLAARATRRLAELLGAGSFTLRPIDRTEDAYGRRLFTVLRHGESLGARLEAEGLAARWRGYRHDWCRAWTRSGSI